MGKSNVRFFPNIRKTFIFRTFFLHIGNKTFQIQRCTFLTFAEIYHMLTGFVDISRSDKLNHILLIKVNWVLLIILQILVDGLVMSLFRWQHWNPKKTRADLRARSFVVSDLNLETKGSRFVSGWGELPPVIARIMSNCLWGGGKW